MLLTLDTSVIVAGLRTQEARHQECRRVLDQVRAGQHIGVQPFTVLVEVAAAIRRRTGSQDLALRVYQDLRSLSSLRFVELDALRADGSMEIARLSGVRGMDAIVVQVAREFNSFLVSLDDEMVDRVKNMVSSKPVTDF